MEIIMQTETIHEVLSSFIFYLQTKMYWRIMSRFILRYKIDPCILRVRPSKKIRMNTKIVNCLESIQHKTYYMIIWGNWISETNYSNYICNIQLSNAFVTMTDEISWKDSIFRLTDNKFHHSIYRNSHND